MSNIQYIPYFSEIEGRIAAELAVKQQGVYIVEQGRHSSELWDFAEYDNIEDAMNELKRLWNIVFYSEIDDLEPEGLPDGFAAECVRFTIMTEETFRSIWR